MADPSMITIAENYMLALCGWFKMIMDSKIDLNASIKKQKSSSFWQLLLMRNTTDTRYVCFANTIRYVNTTGIRLFVYLFLL